MSASDWATHLARAGERYPEAVSDAAAFEDIPERVANTVDRFRDGPAAWLHVDCHLDNVLWRPDGSAVLLDFAGAAVGPPEVDLARLLSEGIEPAWRPALVEAYVDELARQDGEAGGVDTRLLQERFDLALPVLVQAAVTWAAAAKPSVPRAAVVRERWLASVCRLALGR
jgi:Ser/Thr protein kinase RdoA (MazF antagonist)